MPWHPSYTPIRDALAGLFPRRDLASSLVDEAGLRPGRIDFSDRAETNWHAIITEADRSAMVPDPFRLLGS
jgi:hypothetical protein